MPEATPRFAEGECRRITGLTRWPIETDQNFDPIEVLHYAIEELGHSQGELGKLLGSRSRASEILARRRALTAEMVHKVSEAWKNSG